ncbi:MAG: HD domain-containing protein [Lutimonas sp.]
MNGYISLRNKIITILKTQLAPHFYYHGIHHTLDVLEVCNSYIRREKIQPNDSKLLRLAVLLHDIGFVQSDENHEETGAEMADELMSEYGFSKKDIQKVQNMILATKIPQNPQDHLERIICDVDLDYLGRSDYHQIAGLLFEELKVRGRIKEKKIWIEIQIEFLKMHSYHTEYAQRYREPNKKARVIELENDLIRGNF